MAIIAGNPQPLTRGLAVSLFLQRSNNLSDLTNAGTARTNLGLGTIATQNANNVTISGGSISGITDLAIADGGTGQSTAQAAIDALTDVASATNEHVLTKDTATGNAIFKVASGGSGTPGGSDTQVQFNDGGAFGGDADLTWNKTTNVLTATGTINATSALQLNGSDINTAGVLSNVAYENQANVFTLAQTIRISSAPLPSVSAAFTTAVPSGTVPWAFKQNAARSGTPILVFMETSDGQLGQFGANAAGLVLGTPSGLSTSLYAGGSFSSPQFVISSTLITQTVPVFTGVVNAVNAVSDLLTVAHGLSGTPGAGFGTGILLQAGSTTTSNQNQARISSLWNVSTHASRVADIVAEAYYSGGASEIWRGRAGASPAFSVLGATPVVRQAHIADPSGGGTQDAEARTAINAILVVLENFGFVATS